MNKNEKWGCFSVIFGLYFIVPFFWEVTRALYNGELNEIRQNAGDPIFFCVVIFFYGMMIFGLIYLWIWMMVTGEIIERVYDKLFK